MTPLKDLALAGGILIVLGNLLDLVRALIVPRPHTVGPGALWTTILRAGYAGIALRIADEKRRDNALAMGEPLVLLGRLVWWMSVALAGFGLMVYATGHSSFPHAFIESGSSLFTLGIASEPGAGPSIVAFLAAGFGLLVVALQIAYLPTLYDAFNRRETLVTMLESRAGSPAWGPELIARHWLVGIESKLPELYQEWERWSADVAESHSTYPMLMWFRSPHAANSWIVGLTSVLDAAALHLALNPSTAPPEARLCVRMGFTCLRDIARAAQIPYDADPLPTDPVKLTYDEFSEAIERLRQAGVPIERSAEEAWPQYKGWRVNYEAIVYLVASMVFAPPAPWTGPRKNQREAPRPDRPVDRRPETPQSESKPS